MPGVVLALFLIPPPVSDATPPRVRPLDDAAHAIVAAGARSSPTVGQLLAAIEASDVVAYIETTVGLPTRGDLRFMARSGSLTYVLIRIDVKRSPRDRIAALAHELTHAVEVAQACPPVASEADLAAMYEAIGFRVSARQQEFESARARANERQARTELDGRTASPKTHLD